MADLLGSLTRWNVCANLHRGRIGGISLLGYFVRWVIVTLRGVELVWSLKHWADLILKSHN